MAEGTEDMNVNFDERFKFRSWDEYDLYKDSTIDKHALDLEAEKHAHIMLKWADVLAQAQAILAQKKEALVHAEGTLFLRGRTELPNKPSEATIKAWMVTQPEFRRAQRAKRKAENDVNYLQNAKAVLENKRSMIKIAADLWVCGYYARPHIRKELTEQQDGQVREEVQTHLRDSLEKRHLRHEDEE